MLLVVEKCFNRGICYDYEKIKESYYLKYQDVNKYGWAMLQSFLVNYFK